MRVERGDEPFRGLPHGDGRHVSLQEIVGELLRREAGDRGVAAVSVVERHGADPISVWTPELERPPRFLIYSITKTFTAVLILRMCEDGRLELTDPVATWFPEVPESRRMTVEQLLNHSSGIPDYGGLAAYHMELQQSPTRPWSFERFAAETYEKGLLFPPGEGWSYSNPGYMLLKGIAEQLGGKSYAALIADHITTPLALRDTAVVHSLEDMKPLAAGTSSELAPDGQPRDVRAYYDPGWVSHGVIGSSCSDVARFFDSLFAGSLLSGDRVREMLELIRLETFSPEDRDALPLRPESPSYGLGLMGDPDSPWGLLVGHNGGGPCYRASAFTATKSGVSVCAMAAIEQGFSTESVVAQTLNALIPS